MNLEQNTIFPYFNKENIILIAGPCSAESRKQVLDTAMAINHFQNVNIYRAGIWKPRTSPNSFEGVGEIGLKWMKEVKQKTNLLTSTEVAVPEHIEACLRNKGSIDILWIGARTTANPFSVQSLADALESVDIPVIIKNPVNPDIGLWIGAVERLMKAGIKQLALLHRGFSPFEKTYLRNIPKWELAIEIKSRFPELPIINDPSHISGNKQYIHDIAQKSLNLNFNGLMIETHINPKEALSDAEQQLTPKELGGLLKVLKYRKTTSESEEFLGLLEQYREQIDSIDFQLLELLAKRMKIIDDIGKYKSKHNVTAFQLRRWLNIMKTRIEFGKSLQLNDDFVKKMLRLVHKESISKQVNIMTKNDEEIT